MEEYDRVDSLNGSIAISTEDIDNVRISSLEPVTEVNNNVTDGCSDAKVNNLADCNNNLSSDDEEEKESNQSEAAEKSGSAKSLNRITYTINDVPSWYLCIALGFQVQQKLHEVLK